MISLVIYGIIAISLASAAGYALLTFSNTSRQTTFLQENTVRMETAAAAVSASLLELGTAGNSGTLFAPMGQSVSDGQGHTYTGLPAMLGVMGTAPWGQPFLYCPVSLNNTSGLASNALNTLGTTSVTSPSGATYTVSTYIGTATGASASAGAAAAGAYVVTSSTPPVSNIANGGYLTSYTAFIVSSLGPGDTIPDCGSVVVNSTTGNVTVPKGTVRGVKAGLAHIGRLVSAIDRTELYVSTATAGDSSGRDANNPTTLDFALSLWMSLQPHQTDIYLAAASGGSVYNLGSDLNVLAGRSFADGENTNLVIGTMPGASANATLNFTGALTLNSGTTFQNVSVNAGGNGITAFKPVVLNNVTYVANSIVNGANTNNPVLSVYGTNLLVNDSSFTNTQIMVNNSTAEFYNRRNTPMAFSNTQIGGSLAHVTFEGAAAGTPAYSFSHGTVVPISLTASKLNIAPNATLSSVSTGTSILLTGSAMNVGGTVFLSGGSLQGGINAVDNSVVDITTSGIVTVTQSAGQMNYGIFLRGSKLGLEGLLSTSGLVYGAVGIQQGALTGTGAIAVGQPNSVACIRLLQGVADGAISAGTGPSPVSIPIFITPTTATDPNGAFIANYPSFAQAQYGYPPMLNYLNNTVAPASSVYPLSESTAASELGNASLAPNSPNNDPVVYATSLTAVPNANTVIGYVDPITLERAVRNLVNAEFVTGTALNFGGSCRS